MISEKKTEDHVEDITDIVGSFRKWQIWIFAATIYFELISANIANVTMFLVPGNLDYWCNDRPDLAPPVLYSENINSSKNYEGICWYDENSTRTKCKTWKYDTTTYSSSIVEKWDLVCDKGWLVSFSMTVTIFGDLIGCLVFGYLADKVGRRKTMLIALVPALVGSVGTFFAPEMVTFLFCRLLCGAAGLGFITCSFVLLMEVVGLSARPAVGNGIKVGLTFGGILLGLTGYFFRYWQLIQLASTLPLVIMTVVCWLLPESPRWLLLNNRDKEAKEILLKAARMNGINKIDVENKVAILAERLRKEKSTGEEGKRITLLDLLRTRNMRIKTFLMTMLWLVSGFVSHSLLMNLTVFGKNLVWGPALVLCAEFPSIAMGHVLFKTYGCKWVNQVSWLFLTVVTFGISFTGNSGYWTLMCCLAVMKIITAMISNGLYIQSAEIFPTVARTVGLGTCSSFARVSAMMTPFLKEMYYSLGMRAPFLLLSSLSLCAAVLSVFLPNTHGKPLPETLQDAEEIPLFHVCVFKRHDSSGERERLSPSSSTNK